MGILLGLATALSWGSADLCARFATRKIGTFRTMLYMQLSGFLLLTACMPLLGGWGHLMDGSGPRIVGVGHSRWADRIHRSTLSLYRSFEIGKMSIVAPVSASYPVLTMLLSVLTGERITPVRLTGMALTIVGVVLVARGEEIPDDANPIDEQTQPQKKNIGLGWALFSASGFGVMFWLLGIRIVPMMGAAPSVWIIRLTSVCAPLLVILARAGRWLPPAKRDAPWILGIGVLDTSAYVFNNFGMRLEQISVVSVLASLYGAVTVALAAHHFEGARFSLAVARNRIHLCRHRADQPLNTFEELPTLSSQATQGICSSPAKENSAQLLNYSPDEFLLAATLLCPFHFARRLPTPCQRNCAPKCKSAAASWSPSARNPWSA